MDRLNKSIEDGHVLDWKKFKQLKQENDSSPLLDKFDLISFYEYFTKLFDKPPNEPCPSDIKQPDTPTQQCHILNKEVSHNELEKVIKNLKKGKSCSTDLILNEMFEHLTPLASCALLKIFNHCLSSGKYPWHTERKHNLKENTI